MSRIGELLRYVLRAVRRTRPWVLRYLLMTLPALLLVALVAFALLPWFRLPLLLGALDARSLDGVVEVLRYAPGETPDSPLLGFALLALPLIWIATRLLGLLIEGGILATYASDETLSWRAFLRASTRWFWSFFLIGLVGTVVTLVVIGLVAGVAAVAGVTLGSSSLLLLGVGLALLGLVRLWIELARSAAVVQDDKRMVHALRSGSRLLGWRPLLPIALLVLTRGFRVLLWLVSRTLSSKLPWDWWLLTLLVQQPILMVSLVLPLMRKAGEVGLARDFLTSQAPTSESKA